eukprot:SAG25_NODE_161_length_13366_cov_13.111973_11_plen_60_part_00
MTEIPLRFRSAPSSAASHENRAANDVTDIPLRFSQVLESIRSVRPLSSPLFHDQNRSRD